MLPLLVLISAVRHWDETMIFRRGMCYSWGGNLHSRLLLIIYIALPFPAMLQLLVLISAIRHWDKTTIFRRGMYYTLYNHVFFKYLTCFNFSFPSLRQNNDLSKRNARRCVTTFLTRRWAKMNWSRKLGRCGTLPSRERTTQKLNWPGPGLMSCRSAKLWFTTMFGGSQVPFPPWLSQICVVRAWLTLGDPPVSKCL